MTQSRPLIAFYSRTGNTEYVAKIIHDSVAGDMFQIDTVTPYPSNYYATTDVAKKELQSNARPALSKKLDSIADYNLIYLGYPNWWSTMPMVVWTFLESFDWSGKIIVPFCTHGGGGSGRSEKDIATLCPGARVLKSLAIAGANVRASQRDIAQWIEHVK